MQIIVFIRFSLQSSMMTYAVIGYFTCYLGYHTIEALYYGKKPDPVASDFKKFDRTTKKYVD